MINKQDWTFETSDIADSFDEHVREQLPWYDMATNAVAHITRHYLSRGGLVYDVGAGTGNIGCSLKNIINEREASIIGIEPSQEMIQKYNATGQIFKSNAEDFDYKDYDVAICFLVFMFIPTSKREDLMKKLMNKCKKGGVIIIVDKCEPKGGYISTVFYRLALAAKLANNVPADEILKKEMSLSGVQIPFDTKIMGGFGVEFIRYGDFAGWIIEVK